MNPISLNLRQAADATGLSEKTIRNAVNKWPKPEGLPSKRHGVKILIRYVDLEAWVDRMENARA